MFNVSLNFVDSFFQVGITEVFGISEVFVVPHEETEQDEDSYFHCSHGQGNLARKATVVLHVFSTVGAKSDSKLSTKYSISFAKNPYSWCL